MTKKNYTIGSGNVFADLALENPQEALTKAELARQINNLIEQKNLTQIEAAQLLGVDQPKISALTKGKLSGFSLERLFRFLNTLGQDITIKITKSRSSKKSNVSVSLPASSSRALGLHARKKK